MYVSRQVVGAQRVSARQSPLTGHAQFISPRMHWAVLWMLDVAADTDAATPLTLKGFLGTPEGGKAFGAVAATVLEPKQAVWIPEGKYALVTVLSLMGEKLEAPSDVLILPFLSKKLKGLVSSEVADALHRAHKSHIGKVRQHACWKDLADSHEKFLAAI